MHRIFDSVPCLKFESQTLPSELVPLRALQSLLKHSKLEPICNWDLSIQDCYWAGRRLPLDIDVYDYWGNWIENPSVTVSTIPSGGVVTEGGLNSGKCRSKNS